MDKSLLKERSTNYRQKVQAEIRKRILGRNRVYLTMISAQDKPSYTTDEKLSRILDLVFRMTHSRVDRTILSNMQLLFEMLIDNQGHNAKIFDYIIDLAKYVLQCQGFATDTNALANQDTGLQDEMITWILRILIELAEESIEIRYLILNSSIVQSVISESITCNDLMHLSLAASFLNSLLSHNTNDLDKFNQNSYDVVFTGALVKLHNHMFKSDSGSFHEETNSNENVNPEEFKMGVLDSVEGLTKLIDENTWYEFIDRSKLITLLNISTSFLKMFSDDLQMTDSLLSLLQSLSSHVKEPECSALVSDSELFTLLKKILLSSTKQMSLKRKIIFSFSNLIITSLKIAMIILSDTDIVNFLLQNVVQQRNNQMGEDSLLCICNVTGFMDRFVVEFVVRFDIVEFLFEFIKDVQHDSDSRGLILFRIFLEALENLLYLDRQFNFQLKEKIAEGDKIQFIAEQQYATSKQVYNKAQDILNEFFEDFLESDI